MTIRRASRIPHSWIWVMAALTVMHGVLTLAAGAAAQDAGLRIVVLEGEDSVNIIERGTAVPILVEVRDRNDLPVSGASVLFLLGEGGTATLNAGLQQLALTTNALGQAAVAVNPLATGAVELSVSATFAGETATAAIVQTNFATVAEAAAAGLGTGAGTGTGAATATGAGAGAGGGLGTGAVVGIVGAAVGGAVGAGVALAGGESSTPTPTPLARAPSRPSAPTLTAGDGRLEVSWVAPASNGAAIDDYDVRYRTGGGSWTEASRRCEEHVDDGDDPGPEERDRVRGAGACGELGGRRGVVGQRDRHAGGAGLGAGGPVSAEVDGGRWPVGGELDGAGRQRRGDQRLRRAVWDRRRQLDGASR